MKVTAYIILILIVFSCKKPEDRACIKSTGELKTVEINVPTFDKLWLGPHMKYVLVQDTVEKVVISGGENLLNFITTNVENNTLVITNENKCNFLRTYKKNITVEIHVKDLIKVEFEGTKELSCQNQLVQNNVLFLIRDGAGEVNLNLLANSLTTIVTHGWGNFKLEGTVNFLKLEVKSNGFGSTYNMDVNDSIYVISTTAENIAVNCDNALMRAEIGSIGDIEYKGFPSFLQLDKYGSGELIDNN